MPYRLLTSTVALTKARHCLDRCPPTLKGCHNKTKKTMNSIATLLTILAPVIVIPMTVLTFYLRSLRDIHTLHYDGCMRRMESLEASVVELRHQVAVWQRDFTCKEEWLRECMYARKRIEHWSEVTSRLEANMKILLQKSVNEESES